MSARSSARNTFVLAVALAACGKGSKAREADPAQAQALAKRMIETTPPPAGAPACTAEQLAAAPLTARTLIQLAGQPMPTNPERADWINPPELDTPSARVLVDPAADETAKRQAAATFLASKAFLVYRVEMVNVPLALEIKELKRGAVGFRAIGYDAKGSPTCILVFNVQNDKAVSEWAMDQTDKAIVDPAVAKALREDLKKQLLAKIPTLKPAS